MKLGSRAALIDPVTQTRITDTPLAHTHHNATTTNNNNNYILNTVNERYLRTLNVRMHIRINKITRESSALVIRIQSPRVWAYLPFMHSFMFRDALALICALRASRRVCNLWRVCSPYDVRREQVVG